MGDIKIDLDKEFIPNVGNLNIDGCIVTSQILDEELDILDCEFNNNLCVQINTSDLQYITLSIKNLNDLKVLIRKADKYFKSD